MVRQVESMMKEKSSESIKFLCSYGGKILPRSTDGKLRYVGGLTRVLSVERSISFAELMVKLVEFCGYSVTLRCQLPNGDLDTLITIKSDEDLKNVIQEYDEAALTSGSSTSKIRAILSPPKSLKQISPPPSNTCSVNSSSCKSSDSGSPVQASFRRRSFSPPRPMAYPVRACYYPSPLQRNPKVFYNVPCHTCWH
ncbi:hypothetical protein PTKIN_Ptkin04bG0001300 [Pterospermum kingtungense]